MSWLFGCHILPHQNRGQWHLILPKAEIISHGSLRGIAALVVVCLHLVPTVRELFPDIDYRVLQRANLMVDLFFVLSGYILCHVYEGSLRSLDRASLFDFYIARFARIYPLHITALIGLLVFYAAGYVASQWQLFDGEHRSLQSLATNFFLVNAWGLHAATTWNTPAWSISAEFAFYLVFPFGLATLQRYRLSLILLAACILGGYAMAAKAIFGAENGMQRAVVSCGAGMFIFHVRHWVSWLTDRTLTWLQLTAVFAVVMLFESSCRDVFVLLLLTAIVWLTWEDRGLLSRCLHGSFFQYLGRISYSIYMVHFCVILMTGEALDSLVRHGVLETSDIVHGARIGIIVMATFGLGDLSYRYLEMPARRAIRRRAAVSRSALPARARFTS